MWYKWVSKKCMLNVYPIISDISWQRHIITSEHIHYPLLTMKYLRQDTLITIYISITRDTNRRVRKGHKRERNKQRKGNAKKLYGIWDVNVCLFMSLSCGSHIPSQWPSVNRRGGENQGWKRYNRRNIIEIAIQIVGLKR
jgi:hypothetical protein